MHKGHIVTGTLTGTGAAIDVQLGFVPQHVRIVNETKLSKLEWFNTMANASGIKTVTAGTISKITTGGVSPYAGAAGTAGAGFTIGTDANINAASDVIHYFAFSADS